MDLIHGFNASGTFYDDISFPYGFSKSGFFSIPESEMLERLGQRLFSLEQGLCDPGNQVEENFIAVCKGDKDPETRVERLWQKYKRHAMRKSTMTLGSIPSDGGERESFDEDSL